MSIPRVMPSPRRLIHELLCVPQAWSCRFSAKGAATNRVGDECQKLDELLDFNDEMVLFGAARKLEREHDALTIKGRNALGAGLIYAYELTSPYEEMSAFNPKLHDEPPHAHDHPDCPACVEGRKHFHRKKDGSTVKTPPV